MSLLHIYMTHEVEIMLDKDLPILHRRKEPEHQQPWRIFFNRINRSPYVKGLIMEVEWFI